ncbi:hypothetical protein CAC42_3592 [Sphaceloma murrayae]|uniref:Uncharacterized protein n=1 Tax=Sphaceloma murrayae TaxID=2082308 RepID=A0A2K1QSU5_9PEZI|nr:hypothetical protein CAC42_3592 [Sphaceloma murrayae]
MASSPDRVNRPGDITIPPSLPLNDPSQPVDVLASPSTDSDLDLIPEEYRIGPKLRIRLSNSARERPPLTSSRQQADAQSARGDQITRQRAATSSPVHTTKSPDDGTPRPLSQLLAAPDGHINGLPQDFVPGLASSNTPTVLSNASISSVSHGLTSQPGRHNPNAPRLPLAPSTYWEEVEREFPTPGTIKTVPNEIPEHLNTTFKRLMSRKGWIWGTPFVRMQWYRCVSAEYRRTLVENPNLLMPGASGVHHSLEERLYKLQKVCELFDSNKVESLRSIKHLIPLNSVNKCHKFLARIHVNLMDLMEAIAYSTHPRTFLYEGLLRRHTMQTRRYFPLNLLRDYPSGEAIGVLLKLESSKPGAKQRSLTLSRHEGHMEGPIGGLTGGFPAGQPGMDPQTPELPPDINETNFPPLETPNLPQNGPEEYQRLDQGPRPEQQPATSSEQYLDIHTRHREAASADQSQVAHTRQSQTPYVDVHQVRDQADSPTRVQRNHQYTGDGHARRETHASRRAAAFRELMERRRAERPM